MVGYVNISEHENYKNVPPFPFVFPFPPLLYHPLLCCVGVFLVGVRLCYIVGDTILLKCVFFYIIHLGTYVMCRYGKC